MPTVDIIGYLWLKRQALDLDGLPDVLDLQADLQRLGLECVRVTDIKIFGATTMPSVEHIRRDPEEWERLVHDVIVRSSVEDTIHMIHEGGEHE